MYTRSSSNWKSKAGRWDTIGLRHVDFDGDYPEIHTESFLFSNIAEVHDYKNISRGSLVSSFVDDYILERFWNKPMNYIHRFAECSAVMSPDFSVLIGMPKPMIEWQVYRSRVVGHVFSQAGLNVLPTVTWGDYNSFDIVFNGIPHRNPVAISNIGCNTEDNFRYFIDGFYELIERVNPKTIYFMCNKMYKPEFEDIDNIIFLPSFWDRKRKRKKKHGR